MEEKEVSAHLYETVPLHPEQDYTPTIESVYLSKRQNIDLPRERCSTTINTRNRPRTSLQTDSIFSGMKIHYDISYRKQSKQIKNTKEEEFPTDLEPTLVNVHPPRGKFWVAQQRKDAQILQDELDQLNREAEKEASQIDDEFLANTMILERGIQSHQIILDKFTDQATENTPERGTVLQRVANYYRELAKEIPKIKAEFEYNLDDANKRLAESQQRKDQLEKERDASINQIDRQNKTIDGLKQQIADYRLRCQGAENQLRDITNDKAAMIRSSQTNQQKLLEIGDQINEKMAQKDKLNDMIDTLTKDITRRTNELKEATATLKDLEQELAQIQKQSEGFDSIINDREALKEKLIIAATKEQSHSMHATASTQVNLLQKKERENRQKPQGEGKNSSISGQDQFKQIKSDLTACQKQMNVDGEPIVIRNMEDLKKIRETILKNNGIFDYSINSITNAHQGRFDLRHVSSDEARIFAQWIMRRVMRNATAWRSLSHQITQTDPFEDPLTERIEVDEDADLIGSSQFRKAPKVLMPFLKSSRLVGLLDGDESSRPPRGLDWLVHSIRSIFDEKTVDDRTQKRHGDPIVPLPEYLLKWAFRQFGRPDLVQKGCWDIFISSHHHMQKYLEITLFVRFLDENWGTEQLTFFLDVRMWIMTRCVSVPVQHYDLEEYLTETYLTKAQVADLFRTHFKRTEPEIIEDLIVRGCSCTDPTRGNEDEAACIPMNRILELAVGEQIDERVRRLRRMLAFFRPVPRMTLKRFGIFTKMMIPNIDPNLIDSLYRSSLVPNQIRTDLDQDEFIELFRSPKPVLPKDYEGDYVTCEQFAEFSPNYAMVLNRTKQFAPFLQRMLAALAPSKAEETRILVNEIRHEQFQLLEAKVSFDGVMFYQNYHRILEVVMNACFKLNLPDAFTFTKQVEDFESILFKKHESIAESNEHSSEPPSPK